MRENIFFPRHNILFYNNVRIILNKYHTYTHATFETRKPPFFGMGYII